jgi:hypothetical protein
MRDGTLLYADVYRPAGEGEYPVLLQRTPYNKALPTVTGLMGDALRFAGAGYAVVIQDTRGRYASDGEFYVFRDDVQDGYDTVQWCARLADDRQRYRLAHHRCPGRDVHSRYRVIGRNRSGAASARDGAGGGVSSTGAMSSCAGASAATTASTWIGCNDSRPRRDNAPRGRINE